MSSACTTYRNKSIGSKCELIWLTIVLSVAIRLANGALSFEKMDEVAIVEFVLKIVNKFETMQHAFKSVTRDHRN